MTEPRDLLFEQTDRINTALREVISLGQECVVWITGDPNDAADITTWEEAMRAIRAAHKLGQKRNDEANDLRTALQMFLNDGQSALLNPKATEYANAVITKWQVL